MGFYIGDKLRVKSNCETGVVLPAACYTDGLFEIVGKEAVKSRLYPNGCVRYLLESVDCGLNKLWVWAVPGCGFHGVEGFSDRSIRR